LEGKITAIMTPAQAVNLIDTDNDDQAMQIDTPESSAPSAIRAGVVEDLEIHTIKNLMPALTDKAQELGKLLETIGPVNANQDQVAALRLELERLQTRQARLNHQLDVFTHQHASGQCNGPDEVQQRIRQSGLHRNSPNPGYVHSAPHEHNLRRRN
jgi:hypothetical protein